MTLTDQEISERVHTLQGMAQQLNEIARELSDNGCEIEVEMQEAFRDKPGILRGVFEAVRGTFWGRRPFIRIGVSRRLW